MDPLLVRVLRTLDPIARSSDCEYFVAGATARDLILVNLHGMRPGRATRDIDFGFALENWEQFLLLKERLLGSARFFASPAPHRLLFTDTGEGVPIPIDLIPFGGIESPAGTIAWPPGRDIVMSIVGFREALDSSLRIEIESGLAVRVASIPGLALLKLTAWAERGLETN